MGNFAEGLSTESDALDCGLVRSPKCCSPTAAMARAAAASAEQPQERGGMVRSKETVIVMWRYSAAGTVPRLKSSGAVQCEVCNLVCLASDHAQTDHFWCEAEKGKCNNLQIVLEAIQSGSLGVTFIGARCASIYVVSSHAEIAKSVLSDGLTFYRLNTVQVNWTLF